MSDEGYKRDPNERNADFVRRVAEEIASHAERGASIHQAVLNPHEGAELLDVFVKAGIEVCRRIAGRRSSTGLRTARLNILITLEPDSRPDEVGTTMPNQRLDA